MAGILVKKREIKKNSLPSRHKTFEWRCLWRCFDVVTTSMYRLVS